MRMGPLQDNRYKMPAQKRTFGGYVYDYLMIGTIEDVKRLKKTMIRSTFKMVNWQGKQAIYTRNVI
jgi:hypothetical protein